MTKNEKKILFDELKMLAIAIGAEVTEERLQFYAEYLSKYSLEISKKAIYAAMETCKFFPSIAELNEIIKPNVSLEDKSAYLSGKILKAVRTFGSHQAAAAKNDLGDMLWDAVESVGGWYILCTGDEKQMSNTRAQLRKAVSGSIQSKTINMQLKYDNNSAQQLE